MFKDNYNVHFQVRRRDDLPKEIRGKARWTLLESRDWSYIIHVEGKPCSIEYINNMWYRTGWSADTQKYFTNLSQRIEHPEQSGLGTKTTPILSETDQKRLQGVPSIKKTNDDQEEEPSTRREGFLDQEAINCILLGDAEDQHIGDACTNDELLTLIGKVEMTITKTMTETAQQAAEAHIKGGGPTDENPI